MSNYWLMLKRRGLPAGFTFLTVLSLALLQAFQEKPIYEAVGQLKFEESQRSSKLIGLDSAVDDESRQQSSLRWQRSLDTEILTMKSPRRLSMLALAIESQGLFSRPSVEQIKSGLDISQFDETNVVQIRFKSYNREFPKNIVNLLMQQYVDNTPKSKQASTQSAISFIEKQLPQVKQRVNSAETALRKFKETYQIADLEIAKSANATNLSQLQTALDEIDRELVEVQTQQLSLQNMLKVNPQQAILGISTAHKNISTSLEEIDKDLAEAKSNFREDHPAVLELLERQAQLKQLLSQKIEKFAQSDAQLNFDSNQEDDLRSQLIQLDIRRNGLSKQQLKLRQQLSSYRQQARNLPQLEQRQNELERTAKASASTYRNLLEQIQELKVTENQSPLTVSILESATDPEPSKTTFISAAMRGGLAGILLASGVVYVLERIDRKLKSKDEIRQVYPYRVLGEIPLFDESEAESLKLPTLSDPASHLSEAYRMLQSSLKFHGLEHSPRVLMMTSAINQEGKSTTCANLAVSLAQMNHRVLLIDADIRLASQHQIWELGNQEGLTHILLNKHFNYHQELPTHKVADNLEIITAGRISSNPLPMLESEQFANFVQVQIEHYDYILIDAPPLVSVADPLIIGKVVDGILLVARPGHLEREYAQKAHELLIHSNLSVLGTVINGILNKNELYSYYSRYGHNSNQEKTAIKRNLLKQVISK
ncbi:lipopolysaccharide biosynthesis protein, putative [Acaryochloris marina MBIC11017]|uniref:non-specific protein-tyrosine kinase n=1 Tax=Acaryochloris marina (strain MBIC 11017) TaxID=329726 RepID=B0CA08_ACAM1|nr:lipopolysaccharide biosynthesis protein, putative [Acaryochloris marina MBIC11017]